MSAKCEEKKIWCCWRFKHAENEQILCSVELFSFQKIKAPTFGKWFFTAFFMD
jgi:hypothetical protein